MNYFENSICANGDPQDRVYDIDSKTTESLSKKNLHLAKSFLKSETQK